MQPYFRSMIEFDLFGFFLEAPPVSSFIAPTFECTVPAVGTGHGGTVILVVAARDHWCPATMATRRKFGGHTVNSRPVLQLAALLPLRQSGPDHNFDNNLGFSAIISLFITYAFVEI